MSREEAIKGLKNVKEQMFGKSPFTEALEMAIQALSQEPKADKPMCDRNICLNNEYNGIGCDECIVNKAEQEPCDDAVSREAVLDEIDATDRRGGFGCKLSYTRCRGHIEQLPPVTQKSGKWIKHPEIETSTPEYLMFYECSECGDKQCFCKSDIHKKRFCSNCGAKMVEPQESEE